jgi:hypothetical protein
MPCLVFFSDMLQHKKDTVVSTYQPRKYTSQDTCNSMKISSLLKPVPHLSNLMPLSRIHFYSKIQPSFLLIHIIRPSYLLAQIYWTLLPLSAQIHLSYNLSLPIYSNPWHLYFSLHGPLHKPLLPTHYQLPFPTRSNTTYPNWNRTAPCPCSAIPPCTCYSIHSLNGYSHSWSHSSGSYFSRPCCIHHHYWNRTHILYLFFKTILKLNGDMLWLVRWMLLLKIIHGH